MIRCISVFHVPELDAVAAILGLINQSYLFAIRVGICSIVLRYTTDFNMI